MPREKQKNGRGADILSIRRLQLKEKVLRIGLNTQKCEIFFSLNKKNGRK